MKLLAAVAQMKSGADPDANFLRVEELCKQAKARGASFIAFPENFAFLHKHSNDQEAFGEGLDGPLFTRYKSIARNLQLEISFGGFQERSADGRFYNTHVVVSSNGEIISTYRKIHLFVVELSDGSSFNEAAHCEAGSDIVVAQSAIGTLGLSICYDLRFAELYHALTQQGADTLLIPAAFTSKTGKAHWEVLIRARAIENQCYVIAAAQHGMHYPGRVTHGQAMIVDPWGCVIAQCSQGEGLAFAEIDLDYMRKVRAQMPVSSHRRPDVFKSARLP